MEAQIREIIVKALADGEYRDALLHIADVMRLSLPDDVYEDAVIGGLPTNVIQLRPDEGA